MELHKLLIIFSKGRLGNQLFQLNALLNARSEQNFCLLLGFEQVLRVATVPRRVKIFSPGRFVERFLPRIEELLRALARTGFLGHILLRRNSTTFEKRRGLVPIYVFAQDWFQGWEFLNNQIEIQHQESRGKSFQFRAKKPLVFVHVRRGDYLNWPEGSSTALPISFFEREMQRMRNVLSGPNFIILSDDPDHCKVAFSLAPDAEVLPVMTTNEAFEVMSQCDAGILSASSFSWWAARIASTLASGPWVAPKDWTNWHGFSPGIEIPEADFISFSDVNDNHQP